MMVFIAPDKYRGTLTASEAAAAMASTIHQECMIVPMADGGEGTAECLASTSPAWIFLEKGIFFQPTTRELAIDSSAVIGHGSELMKLPPMSRSSRPLGERILDLYRRFSPRTVYIGIGGTAVCDGGHGFIEELSGKAEWSKILVGLSDVRVPLLPVISKEMSALSFCAQKGYSEEEIIMVARSLISLQEEYGRAESEFAGAGGGLGYALADVLKAKCYGGVEWLLSRLSIPWNNISLVLTGEGRYDAQSEKGKVVAAIAAEAWKHGVPTVCLAGCMDNESKTLPGLSLVDCSRFYPNLPLSKDTAVRRLKAAVLSLNC